MRASWVTVVIFAGLVSSILMFNFTKFDLIERSDVGQQYKFPLKLEEIFQNYKNDFDITEMNETSHDVVITDANKPSCTHRRHLVFIKTHKTGSNTVQKVVHNYEKKMNIKRIRYHRCTPFTGGYPGRFKFKFESPKRYDVIDGHFRFNPDVIRNIMPSDTKYFTVIREPWSHFQSSYNYYEARQNRLHSNCHDYPHMYVTRGRNMDVKEFIPLANQLLNKSVPWYFRFKNYQSHDLGLDPMIDDETKIEDEIKKLDRHLDLVMIMEYMDESMILLKDMLCSKWKTIAITPLNGRRYTKTKLSPKVLNAFKHLDKMDIALYKYFNATFWRKVDAYGRERMDRDLQILRSKLVEGAFQVKKQKHPNTTAREIRPTTKVELIQRLSCFGEKAPEVASYMMANSGGCFEYL